MRATRTIGSRREPVGWACRALFCAHLVGKFPFSAWKAFDGVRAAVKPDRTVDAMILVGNAKRSRVAIL